MFQDIDLNVLVSSLPANTYNIESISQFRLITKNSSRQHSQEYS